MKKGGRPKLDPSEARSSRTLIKVYVSASERDEIDSRAQNAGLPRSVYLRQVGLGYEARSLLDREQVMELIKSRADLGRMGGLLKLWLTDDERVSSLGVAQMEVLLERIAENQDALSRLVDRLQRFGDR